MQATARSASLIDAVVQGQVAPAELTGLAQAPTPAPDTAVVKRPAAAKPRRKRREKAKKAPRKRRKRRYFWLVLKNVRSPGVRAKLFEGDWVEQMDKYDVDQATSPEERAFMERENARYQKARRCAGRRSTRAPALTRRACVQQELKTPLPEQLFSFNDLTFLPMDHDIVYQHEDWEEDGRIAHRSLEVGDLLSGVVVDQYLLAGAFVDCCCEYNGRAPRARARLARWLTRFPPQHHLGFPARLARGGRHHPPRQAGGRCGVRRARPGALPLPAGAAVPRPELERAAAKHEDPRGAAPDLPGQHHRSGPGKNRGAPPRACCNLGASSSRRRRARSSRGASTSAPPGMRASSRRTGASSTAARSSSRSLAAASAPGPRATASGLRATSPRRGPSGRRARPAPRRRRARQPTRTASTTCLAAAKATKTSRAPRAGTSSGAVLLLCWRSRVGGARFAQLRNSLRRREAGAKLRRRELEVGPKGEQNGGWLRLRRLREQAGGGDQHVCATA